MFEDRSQNGSGCEILVISKEGLDEGKGDDVVFWRQFHCPGEFLGGGGVIAFFEFFYGFFEDPVGESFWFGFCAVFGGEFFTDVGKCFMIHGTVITAISGNSCAVIVIVVVCVVVV